jgi:hypothetical protein
MSEKLFKQILTKLDDIQKEMNDLKVSMANKEDIKNINQKLDLITNQVVRNSEDLSDSAKEKEVLAIHHQLDFQLGKIAKAEEELSILKNKQ